MARAVAKKEETNVVAYTDDRPDFVTDSVRGSENVTTADMTIPRLDVFQSTSPQIDDSDAKHIEGAMPGRFWNTATSVVYGKEVLFVPVFFRKEWVIWRDLQKGGGFRGAFQSEAEAQHAKQMLDDADDCDIVDTAQHFGMLVTEDGNVEDIVVSCSKTKHKPSRKLNTLAKMSGGDRFASIYRLVVVGAENAAGQKYFNFDVARLGWVSEAMYERGEKLYEAVKTGDRDVDRRHEAEASSGSRVAPEELDA